MRHLLFAACICICAFAYGQPSKPEIGIAQKLENDSLLKAAGYTCLVESIQNWISPKKLTDDQFDQAMIRFKESELPVYAVNIFIPGDLKLVGPDVREADILDYSRVVFARCQRLGLKLIVWGSGGARRVPDGFDPVKAKQQFIAIAQKVSKLAKNYDIVLSLENLNHTETNFINTVAEALDVVIKVDQSNFKLCADIYHMLMEGEAPAILAKTGKYIVHCDIAEKEGRTPPGFHGDDFRPYLKELYKIGYQRRIVLECNWEDVAKQALSARIALQAQIDEVYVR